MHLEEDVSELESFRRTIGMQWATSMCPTRPPSSSISDIMRDGVVLTQVVENIMPHRARRLSRTSGILDGLLKGTDQATARRRLSAGLRYIAEHYPDMVEQLPQVEEIEQGSERAAAQMLEACVDVTMRRVRAHMQRMFSWYAKLLAPYGINIFGLTMLNNSDEPSAPRIWRAFRSGVPFACTGNCAHMHFVFCACLCLLNMYAGIVRPAYLSFRTCM